MSGSGIEPIVLSREDEFILWAALQSVDDDHDTVDGFTTKQQIRCGELRIMLHDRMFGQPGQALGKQ